MTRAVVLLHLRGLARLRLRTVVAVVAVAAGSSLALSVLVVRSSVDWSLLTFGRQLAGPAALRVVGAQSSGGLVQEVADRLPTVPGVQAAVPVVEAATVVRIRGDRDRAVVALGVTCGQWPSAGPAACTAGAIGISSRLAASLSPQSWMETADGTLSLAGAKVTPALDGIGEGNAVVLGLASAQQLFDRHGRVDAVFVVPKPTVPLAVLAARLRTAAGPQNAVLGAADAPPEIGAVLASFLPLLSVIAVLAAAIAVVLVYNVVSLSLEERRRDHALAAALGASPAVLAAGALLEAAAVGAAGGLVGAAGGQVLAGPTVRELSTLASHAIGVPVVVHAGAGTYVAGLVLGLVIGVTAAVRPMRQARRADVVVELSGRRRVDDGRRRPVLRRALVASGVVVVALVAAWLAERHGALATWQAGTLTAAFLACVTASVLAAGYWAPLTVAGAAPRTPRRAVVRLALANVVREPARSAVVAVAIGASVGVALMTASYDLAIHDGIAGVLARSSQGHGVLVTTAADNSAANTDARIPASALHVLGALPGVAREEPFFVSLSGHSSAALKLVESSDDLAGSPPVDAGVAGGPAYRRGEVMVGAGLARRLHLRPGTTFRLDTPAGLVPVRVEGIWEAGDFGGQNVSMTSARFAQLFGPQLPSAVVLVADQGTPPALLRQRALAAGLPADLFFSTPSRVLTASSARASAQLAPFWALQRALLLVAFISVLCTLLLAGLQRRREHGLMAAVGFGPGEQFRVVCAEAMTLAAVAIVLGIVVGVVDMGSLVQFTPLLIGYHDPYRLDLAVLLFYVPITLAVVLGASLWPAWRASRLAVVEALQYE